MTGSQARTGRQAGFTAIECMISLTLGLMIVLASTAMLLTAQKAYLQVDDHAKMSDAGNHALVKLAAAIRQAGYMDWAGIAPPLRLEGHALFGADDRTEKARSYFYSAPQYYSINGSDVLYTNFMANHADGRIDMDMLNCAGQSARQQAPSIVGKKHWNRSILYLGRSNGNDTELYCKYKGKRDWHAADGIASGIEAMQFLYGVDIDGDGLPDSFRTARQVDALSGKGQVPQPNHWDKVVAVRIAVAVHGNWQQNDGSAARDSALQLPIDLFGAAYSRAQGSIDPRAHYFPWQLQPHEKRLSRHVMHSTVMLRNRLTVTGLP